MINQIELNNIKNFGILERAGKAVELRSAALNTPSLKRELPIPAHGYGRNPIVGFRRLGRIARTADSHKLAAYTIELGDGKSRGLVLGMATAQVAVPKPNPAGLLRGIELSFWHSARHPNIGRQVLRLLIDKVEDAEVPVSIVADRLWMVTLPDDIVKAELCKELGMVPEGNKQPYYINDDVDEPRQLWFK